VLQLLFTAAQWHALAKLRLHNDFTLDILESVTESFGQQLRHFSDKTCSAFATRELPREYSARIRRNATATKLARNVTVTREMALPHQQLSNTFAGPIDVLPPSHPPDDVHMTEHNPPALPTISKSSGAPHVIRRTGNTRQSKTLNLNTYKIHALGDYVSAIRTYGTTDSYSTETVSWFDIHTDLLTYSLHNRAN
jgi:hypothetical protein